MGKGRGRGGVDETGAIAAGCGAMCCMICFFIFGVPILILGIIMCRLAAGDYDSDIQKSITDCLALDDNTNEWYVSYTTTIRTTESWRNHDNEECLQWEDWENAKGSFNTAGIVMILLSLISLVAGLVLIFLMFTSLCKKNDRGMVIGTTNQGGQSMIQTQQQMAAYPGQPQIASPYPAQAGYAYPQQPVPYGYPQGDSADIKPPPYAPAAAAQPYPAAPQPYPAEGYNEKNAAFIP